MLALAAHALPAQRTTKASYDVEPTSRDAWRRLGALLQQRRAQLRPEWSVRDKFVRDHPELSRRTITDLELGLRSNFGQPLLGKVASAYELPAGAIRRVLEGAEDLEPPAEPPVVERQDDGVRHRWVDVEDLARELFPDSPSERELAIDAAIARAMQAMLQMARRIQSGEKTE